MSGRGLPIIEERPRTKRDQLEAEARTICERKWAEKEDSSILESERIKRISNLLTSLCLRGKTLADLGCGEAPYPLEGSIVTGVDIAQNALDRCPAYVQTVRGCLPYVRLPEESFDGVLLADILPELEPHLYRLLLSEASLLMNRDAFCLISSKLDYHSEAPLGHLLALLRTEFEIQEIHKSYHRFYIALRSLLDAPSTFVKAVQDQTSRLKQMETRRGLSRFWFYFNTLKWVAPLWRPLVPLKKRLHNRRLLILLEKLSKILLNESALSHVIILCKRKSLHPDQ